MDCDESNCPPKKKAKLDESKQKSCLFMPVEMENKLESLLNRTTQLCLKQSKGQVQSGLSSFSDLTSAFMEILNDNAVTDWGPNMHNSVKAKCERLLELCVCMIDEDSIPVLEALALLLDPNNKFNAFNASKPSESLPAGSNISDEKLYARPLPDPEKPQGWLVDLINSFGDLGGFVILLTRFQPGRRIPGILIMNALLQPFKQCYKLLTVDTIVNYFVPIVERIPVILDTLTNEEFKKPAKTTSIIPDIHYIVAIINAVKILVSRVPGHKEIIKNLESNISTIRITFMLLMKGENIEQSISNFNYSFGVQEQNDLLEYFQTSWKTANDETRGKMLEAIQRWAKGYLGGTVGRVLALLWDLAHSDEVSTIIMEKTLKIQAEVLPFFDSHEGKGDHILNLLDKCVEEVESNGKWALPALIHIKNICNLFKGHKNVGYLNNKRKDIMKHLRDQHDIITLVINNLMDYMDKMRQLVKKKPKLNEVTFMPDGRYNHRAQVQKRLCVLFCLMRNRTLLPEIEQLKQVWQCLVDESIFLSDCYNAFKCVKLWKSNVNFKQEVIKDFIEHSFHQLDPPRLPQSVYQWFECLFMKINRDDEDKFMLDNLIGIDYLWQVVTIGPRDIAGDGFILLKKINEDAGSQLERSVSDNHKTLIAQLRNQLQVHSDALSRLMGVDTIRGDDERKNEIVKEIQKMIRLMEFMTEYMKECSWEGNEELRE